MRELRCPRCGKLLGHVTRPMCLASVLVWCKRCRAEVSPQVIESKRSN